MRRAGLGSALKEFVVQREARGLHPGQLGGQGSDGGPLPLSLQEEPDTPGELFPGDAGGVWREQRGSGARVEEGLSVPLCLGLGFPSAVESGGAQRTARAQRALVHVVRRPHRSAEGTHARQHWIWFLCDSPRLWEHTDGPS